MRLILFLLLAAAVPSFAALSLVAVAGYSGNYMPGSPMPIAITVVNNGSEIKGEFILTQGNLQSETRICKDYYFPAVFPANCNQLRFIYCNPRDIQTNFKLSFVSNGKNITSTTVTARQFSANDRFVLSAGGHGLDFMNGDVFDPTTNLNINDNNGSATVSPDDAPAAAPGGAPGGLPIGAPGGVSGTLTKQKKSNLPAKYMAVTNGVEDVNNNYNYNYGGNNMNILTGSVEPNILPDNAEGYRAAEILYLPSNVTENSFNSPKVKEAIIGWVSNGGCVIVGNGGVPGRLDTPFFKSILPEKGKKVKLLGIGKVVLLDFDPELTIDANQRKLLRAICYSFSHTRFFTSRIADGLDMMPTSVKPPSISAIIMYLIIYILVVSPINYLILKKIDKRELAWKTTPIIAILFTLIAFTIGLVSKGLNLYINTLSVVHSSTGQKTAEMNTIMSVYSPASRSYKVGIGDNGLFGSEEYSSQYNDYNYNYNYRRQNEEPSKAIRYNFQNSVFSIDDFRMDMWSQRKVVFDNQVSLGNGITAVKIPGGKYKITNGSEINIDRGIIYENYIASSYFIAKAGETVTSQAKDISLNVKNGDFNKIYFKINSDLPNYLNGNGTSTKLVCFCTNGNPDIKVSGKSPTAALTVLILNVE
ncbi:MAG: hypothetical protein WCO98_12895 [bacterium]